MKLARVDSGRPTDRRGTRFAGRHPAAAPMVVVAALIGPGQGWAWLGIGGAREPALDPNWAPRPGPARTRISKWKASAPLTYACGALAGKPAANTQYCRRDEARGEQKRHLVPGLYPQKKLAATVLAAYLTALFQLSSRVQSPRADYNPMQAEAEHAVRPVPVGRRRHRRRGAGGASPPFAIPDAGKQRIDPPASVRCMHACELNLQVATPAWAAWAVWVG